MQTFMNVMRVYIYLILVTFIGLSLCTYAIHNTFNMNWTMEWSCQIAGCFLTLIATQFLFHTMKLKRNWKNILFFWFSILYNVYNWAGLIFKVVKNS